ncbi:MAG TPA: TadE family protein [Steroidobacteraceae bacterium]|nr:TadE family protein [Steroidobacteraceae bacterium]
MSTLRVGSQRGQAMTEFIAAMALFIPLAFGVIYLGKFGDIKHQAIQASRYAALERAMDPAEHEGTQAIKDETVARFFPDQAKHNVGFEDKVSDSVGNDENPNWKQMDGKPLLTKYEDISVQVNTKSIDGSLTSSSLNPIATRLFSGLRPGYAVEADVQVPIASVTHFAPLANLGLKVSATTVIAGDPWNSGSAADVAGHLTDASALGRLPVYTGLKYAFLPSILALSDSPHSVEFGCVKPDVVPKAAAPGAHYDPLDDPESPSNESDRCYN